MKFRPKTPPEAIPFQRGKRPARPAVRETSFHRMDFARRLVRPGGGRDRCASARLGAGNVAGAFWARCPAFASDGAGTDAVLAETRSTLRRLLLSPPSRFWKTPAPSRLRTGRARSPARRRGRFAGNGSRRSGRALRTRFCGRLFGRFVHRPTGQPRPPARVETEAPAQHLRLHLFLFGRRRAGRGGNGQRRFIAPVPRAGRGKFSAQRTRPEERGHRFIADDVLAVLPRLARRGEKFDAIILDPPTFSRNQAGAAFQVQRDFGRLVALALEVAAPGAKILLSVNHSAMRVADLEWAARAALKMAGRGGRFHARRAARRFSSRPGREDGVAGM